VERRISGNVSRELMVRGMCTCVLK
jgi:hypothetical protein